MKKLVLSKKIVVILVIAICLFAYDKIALKYMDEMLGRVKCNKIFGTLSIICFFLEGLNLWTSENYKEEKMDEETTMFYIVIMVYSVVFLYQYYLY
jgi:hypothetical protein